MVEIVNHNLLSGYIAKYNINNLFSSDMTEYMQLVKFAKNEMILQMKDNLEYFYFHVKGLAEIYTALENGKLLLLRFSAPLTALGETEVIESKNVQCTVKAINECICIRIPAKEILKRCYDDPIFLRYLIRQMSMKMCAISKTAPVNLLYPLKDRLISYLILLEEEKAENTTKDGIKTYKIQEISRLLGTSYRHLNRTIEGLIREGIVQRNNGKLNVIDLNKLRDSGKCDLYE